MTKKVISSRKLNMIYVSRNIFHHKEIMTCISKIMKWK